MNEIKILRIHEYGHDCVAGTVTRRTCAKCSGEWAHVSVLPYPALRPDDCDFPVVFDAALCPVNWSSLSGAHYARVGTGDGFGMLYDRPVIRVPATAFPERPRGVSAVLPGPITLCAGALAERALARWTCDGPPHKHEVAAVFARDGETRVFPDPESVTECILCYRERLCTEPSMQQGHLSIAPTPEGQGPRLITTYQPEVVAVAPAPIEVEVRYWSPLNSSDRVLSEGADAVTWFNHHVVLASGPASGIALLTRGQVGSLTVDAPAWVISPDHPQQTWDLAPGTYDLYHPWPARDSRDRD